MGKINSCMKNNKFIMELINNLPAAVFWKNAASVFLGCNKTFAQFANVSSPDDIIGKTDFDLPWGKYQAHLYRREDQLVMQSKQPKEQLEETQTLADGREITVLVSKIPLFADGEVIGVLGVYFDITERKNLQEKLRLADVSKTAAEMANYAKSLIIANLSHDIRSPLTGIISLSQILSHRLQNPQEKQYANWINDSGEKLLDFLNEALTATAGNNLNESEIHETFFDLRQCMEALVQLELPAIKAKNLNFKLKIEEDVPTYIIADRSKLNRIILNLFDNAIKFTIAGEVGIAVKKLSQTDEQICLEFNVHDSGIGIAAHLQDQIYDRFFHHNTFYEESYNCQGLGLNIVQQYVKFLGGKIKFTSEEGKGTTFSFIVNFKLPADNIKLLPPRQFTKTKNVFKKNWVNEQAIPHVLLVDNNSIALRYLENIIIETGCDYSTADSVASAVQLVQLKQIDLVITEIGFPNQSGYDLTSSIRNWEQLNNKKPIPIIGLTSYALQNIEYDCLHAGMNLVVAKPAQVCTINAVIRQYILNDGVTSPTPFIPIEPMGKLGRDLPDAEEQLFALIQYPLLDSEASFRILYNKKIMLNLLQSMSEETLPEDKIGLVEACNQGDWFKIVALAHKMKGGAIYCGTIRLYYACQYLERYHKAGHGELLNKLYEQLLTVIEETQSAIDDWLFSQERLAS